VLTCCPACGTTFRVKPEQLQVRAGKVRCGKCRHIFNALDSLSDEAPAAAAGASAASAASPAIQPVAPSAAPPAAFGPVMALESPARAADVPGDAEDAPGERLAVDIAALPDAREAPPAFPSGAEPTLGALDDPRFAEMLPLVDEMPVLAEEAVNIPDAGALDVADDLAAKAVDGDMKPDFSGEIADILLMPALPEAAAPGEAPGPETPPDAEAPPPLSTEAIRDSALAAGLVAARESTQVPGYNKWAEGPFTGEPVIADDMSRPQWPFALAALLLAVFLAGQAVHHFRSELAVRVPGLRPALTAFCAALGCDIPLPRHGEAIGIDASDLQVDAGHGGLLMLSTTLKNRAPYPQAWPLLEITLTDVRDEVVLRRVLAPADYLPAKSGAAAFAAHGEVALRLWLDTGDIVASGYRLYVFYP
jgi:predicted Zn finger-like uncharacterized protein